MKTEKTTPMNPSGAALETEFNARYQPLAIAMALADRAGYDLVARGSIPLQTFVDVIPGPTGGWEVLLNGHPLYEFPDRAAADQAAHQFADKYGFLVRYPAAGVTAAAAEAAAAPVRIPLNPKRRPSA